MTPRQVAEALDKNYHTTRCLLRKMEAAGLIQHTNSQYIAIPVDNSCNQRNQLMLSALQRDDQVARGEEPCLPATDYIDYVGENVSANVSQTHNIHPPFRDCSLQLSSASEDVLSPREEMQDAQEHRDVGVINRNQCNQLTSATTKGSNDVEQSSPNWADYSGSVDYTDYANESVSAYCSQTYELDPLLTSAALQYLSEGDLLTLDEDIQGG